MHGNATVNLSGGRAERSLIRCGRERILGVLTHFDLVLILKLLLNPKSLLKNLDVVLNTQRQRPKELRVFGTFDNILSQGPPPLEAKI